MKITNMLLFAILGVVAWKVLEPMVASRMLPPGSTPTTSPNASTPPAGQSTGDVFKQVVNILDNIFGTAKQLTQTAAKTQ